MTRKKPRLSELLTRAERKKPAVRRKLLRWFTRQARDLPWRRTKDPYRIWIAELLLQQTRVQTVLPYYHRFLKALPNVAALAAASHEQVLRLWVGLGYYRRVGYLHQAAQAVVRRQNGQFPRTAQQWHQLPGVGRYTAGAIASIAFGQPTPAVDGNAKRVLARLFALHKPLEQPATLEAIWAVAEILVSPTAPGAFNQALMDLASSLCTPRSPRCPLCPLRACCDAYALGQQEQIPRRTPRKPPPHRHVVVAVICKNGRYLLGKRPPDDMLGGLWEFPGGQVQSGETHEQALIRELNEELGIDVAVGPALARVEHAYSHFRVTLHVYRCRLRTGRPTPRYHTALKWVPRSHLRRYPLPGANRKFLDRI